MLESAIVIDKGGPIQAGDNLWCTKPFLSKEKRCDCVKIAMEDATFENSPVKTILVLNLTPLLI